MSAASAAGGQSWAVHEHGSLKRGRALNRREDKVRLGGGVAVRFRSWDTDF